MFYHLYWYKHIYKWQRPGRFSDSWEQTSEQLNTQQCWQVDSVWRKRCESETQTILSMLSTTENWKIIAKYRLMFITTVRIQTNPSLTKPNVREYAHMVTLRNVRRDNQMHWLALSTYPHMMPKVCPLTCFCCVSLLPWLVVVHGSIIVHKCLIHVTFAAHFGRRSGAAVGRRWVPRDKVVFLG